MTTIKSLCIGTTVKKQIIEEKPTYQHFQKIIQEVSDFYGNEEPKILTDTLGFNPEEMYLLFNNPFKLYSILVKDSVKIYCETNSAFEKLSHRELEILQIFHSEFKETHDLKLRSLFPTYPVKFTETDYVIIGNVLKMMICNLGRILYQQGMDFGLKLNSHEVGFIASWYKENQRSLGTNNNQTLEESLVPNFGNLPYCGVNVVDYELMLLTFKWIVLESKSTLLLLKKLWNLKE